MVRKTEFLFAVTAVNVRRQDPPLEVHGCLPTRRSLQKSEIREPPLGRDRGSCPKRLLSEVTSKHGSRLKIQLTVIMGPMFSARIVKFLCMKHQITCNYSTASPPTEVQLFQTRGRRSAVATENSNRFHEKQYTYVIS